MIYTIGDSNACTGWGEIPAGVTAIWLGPVLMFTFGKSEYMVSALETLDLKEGDSIIYSFGSIDCRAHVKKFVKDGLSYKQIIEALVDGYMATVRRNTRHYKGLDINTCIYTVLPPTHNGEVEAIEVLSHPFLGSDEERKEYCEYTNLKIGEACEREGFMCFDVYKEYSDDQGFLLPEYSSDMHIADPKYLIEKIKELGL